MNQNLPFTFMTAGTKCHIWQKWAATCALREEKKPGTFLEKGSSAISVSLPPTQTHTLTHIQVTAERSWAIQVCQATCDWKAESSLPFSRGKMKQVEREWINGGGVNWWFAFRQNDNQTVDLLVRWLSVNSFWRVFFFFGDNVWSQSAFVDQHFWAILLLDLRFFERLPSLTLTWGFFNLLKMSFQSIFRSKCSPLT